MILELSQLGHIRLFQGLTQAQLEFVAEHGRQRTYRTDEAIVHQLDPGEMFYVILHGTVRVSSTISNGNEVFLALLATGDTFGEMSLIDAGFRSADVVTQESTTLLSIDRVAFDQLLDSSPVFARNLMRTLAHRLRLANLRITAHCTLDVYGLVARQILEFSEIYGRALPDGDRLIPIRLTQGNMADLVGSSRERVNQVMVAYKKNGWISVDSNFHIIVHTPDELAKRMQ